MARDIKKIMQVGTWKEERERFFASRRVAVERDNYIYVLPAEHRYKRRMLSGPTASVKLFGDAYARSGQHA